MELFFVTDRIPLYADDIRLPHRKALSYRIGVPGADTGTVSSEAAVELLPPKNGRVTEETLYVAFSPAFFAHLAVTWREATGRAGIRLLADQARNRVLALPGMPVRIGLESRELSDCISVSEFLARPSPQRLRVAVVNQFCSAFGDSIVLLTALRCFRSVLEQCTKVDRLTLLQHPDNREAEEMFLASGVVDSVEHLPAPLAVLTGYHAYADMSPAYANGNRPWVDEMLAMLGVAPQSIPSAWKRNGSVPNRCSAAELEERLGNIKQQQRRVVLLHHRASTSIRSIPDAALDDILESLLGHTDWHVVSALRVSFAHPRFHDVSALTTSFADLAFVVSQCDGVLCVDTSVYHLADALEVPAVVLFTSILPAMRTCYYPTVKGIFVGDAHGRLVGKHSSNDPADLEYAASLWADFDIRPAAEALTEMISVDG